MNGDMYGCKKMTAAEAAALVQSGDRVYVGTATSFASEITEALRQRKGELTDVTILSALGIKPADLYRERNADGTSPFRVKSYFLGPMERAAVKNAIPSDYTSFHLSQMDIWVEEAARPDICFLEVSKPDANGYCSYGPAGGCLHEQVRAYAKTTVLEINQRTPYINGQAGLVHLSMADGYVETDTPVASIPSDEPDETARQISSIIMDYVPDGATVQLGLGGLSTAVGYGLQSKNELGIHSEILSEPLVRLVQNGNVTNRNKGLLDGLSAFGIAIGNPDTYAYLDRNPKFYSAPFSWLNDPRVIAQNRNFISVNTAMSMNLFGEAASEGMAYRQQSGVGGQLDYVRGAQWSPGGKSFIAMASSFVKNGERKSKIVLNFPDGTAVTTPRSDVQYVATEYGCVNLKHLNMSDRVRAMISLAHPDFRDELTDQAKEHGML